MWEKADFKPRPTTFSRNGFTAIQWMRPKKRGKEYEYEFRSVTEADLNASALSKNSSSRHLSGLAGERLGAGHAHRAGTSTDEPIRDARLDALASPFQSATTAVVGHVNHFSDAQSEDLASRRVLNLQLRTQPLQPLVTAGRNGGVQGQTFRQPSTQYSFQLWMLVDALCTRILIS